MSDVYCLTKWRYMMRKVTVSVCGNIEVSARLTHTQIFRSIYSIYLIYLVNYSCSLWPNMCSSFSCYQSLRGWGPVNFARLGSWPLFSSQLFTTLRHLPTTSNTSYQTLNHSSLHWTDHDCSGWMMINNKVIESMNRVEMPLFSVICLGKTVFLNFSIFLINGFSYQFYRFYFAYSLVPSKSLRKN